MDPLTENLISALDRQRSLRSRGGNFDELAHLQSEIHGLRAAIAIQTRRPLPT